MERLVIAGAAGHARVVSDAAQASGRYELVGYLDRESGVTDPRMDAPVIGSDHQLSDLIIRYRIDAVVVAIGDNHLRCRVAALIGQLCPELRFGTVIHPQASLARDVEVGEGTVIMSGVVVNSGSRIGRHCLLNTQSSLDHDGVMEDGASLAPGSTLGGNCHLESLVAIGLGANLIHGIRIGQHTVIGAGSTVLRPITSRVVAYGTPARVIRSRVEGESYL